VRVAGVDGTKGGWIAVELDDGEVDGVRLIPLIESAFSELEDARVIAIDIPIGFGPREADIAARRFLVGATSTVFSTPPRATLEVPFGPGLGVSAQAHALGPRILHVTELAARDGRFHEVHPEVSFRAMNAGAPLLYRKKSAGGVIERLALLARQGIRFGDLGAAGSVPMDDLLDAAAGAWTANRIALGSARSLPDPPEERDGRLLAIWY
jgi:predicted RNase H-like nuclease